MKRVQGWRAVITSGLVMGLTACGGGEAGPGDEGVQPEPVELVSGGDGEAPSSEPPDFVFEPPTRVTPPDQTEPPHENPWQQPELRAVALEGQEAPGTGGQPFRHDQFKDPQVNDHGHVAFGAKYGYELNGTGLVPMLPPGEGVFFWNSHKDLLVPVALTGQSTAAGLMGPHFDWIELNKHNQVAFVADLEFSPRIMADLEAMAAPATTPPVDPEAEGLEPEEGAGDPGAASGGTEEDTAALDAEEGDESALAASIVSLRPEALIQATPLNEECDGFRLDVIARSGNAAPGGGLFWDFDQISQNDHGAIAFEASYFTRQLTPPVLENTLVPQLLPILQEGIFLWTPEKDLIVPVARAGDRVLGTNGLRLCSYNHERDLVTGPWMNKDGVITFLANCFEDENGYRTPSLDGSMVIKRPGEKLELFVAVGSPGPLSSCEACGFLNDTRPIIKEILVGRRGISPDEQVFRLKLTNGLSRYSVVATKGLWEDLYEDAKVCATEGMDLGGGYSLALDGPGEPTLSSCNTIAFEGDITGWERNHFVRQDAIFTCKNGELTVIAHEGMKMPLGEKNEFEDLDDPSNSSKYVVFTEDEDRPTGVFRSTSPYASY